MATQGVVSLMREGRVIIKAVCGCDGYNAEALARLIIERKLATIEDVYNAARLVKFGCPDCLIVINEQRTLMGPWPEPPDLYFSTLNNPQFNPRWEHGTVGELFIIPV